MRCLCLATMFAFACNRADPAACAPSPEASAVFRAAPDAGLPPDILAAINAGRLVEAASDAAHTFDQKILIIAQDPTLSEKWASAVQISGAAARERAASARVAADLPLLANQLRAAGVSVDDVMKVVDGASRGRMSVEDLAETLSDVVPVVEAHGPVKNFGEFVGDRLAQGMTGITLQEAIELEHKKRGSNAEAQLDDAEKVTVCHRPAKNPGVQKTLEIGPSALEAHLAHGDSEGACEGETDAANAKTDKAASGEKGGSGKASGSATRAGSGKGSGSAGAKGGSGKGSVKANEKAGKGDDDE